MLRYRSVFNSTTNKLIIHQSIVDFLGAFVSILRQLLVISPPTIVPDNIPGSVYCKLWWSPFLHVFITSSYNLVAISLERYYATCQPVKHRSMFSSNRLKMVILIIWLCGSVPTAHTIPISRQISGRCDISWPSPSFQAVGGSLVFVRDLVIPMTIMVFAYTKIILELRRRSRARADDNNQDARNMLSRANKNVIKTLLVVAIFFAVCWTPTEIYYMFLNLGAIEVSVYNATLPIFSTVVVVNLCVNPFIYCFTYEHFQKQAKKMVFGGRQRNVNRVDTTSGSTRQEGSTQHTVQVSSSVPVIGPIQNPGEP
ncbi:trace amine-associated receptor 1-like [Asterias amurensis]|uniref:trace amine-associated receptor 1-like n=1 Tax=Asterias amurensis TaxID=7602 RepID=UPI003AB8B59E